MIRTSQRLISGDVVLNTPTTNKRVVAAWRVYLAVGSIRG
jgi:hypothetical protein